MENMPDRIVNIHGHLRHDQNIPNRVKLWEQWHVVKFCCLCLPPRWRQPDAGHYFTNEDFLKWEKEYPDLFVGMGSVDLGPFSQDTAAKVEQLKDQGFEGLKFFSPHLPYNHEKFFPFYEKAQELGMPILFHTRSMASQGSSNTSSPVSTPLIQKGCPTSSACKLAVISSPIW